MGVGLQPLEFTECLADSPQFRDNLQRHEKELEKTSQQIKRLIKEVKDVVSAAKRLSAAQLALASTMEQLEFVCVGPSLTEDERVITRSLRHFAQLMRNVEEERERMLAGAHAQIIEPLERFRKEHIGAVKEGKKKFDKKTAKFCQTQERTLALSTKKPDAVFQEADAALEMASRDFCAASLEYVLRLQATHERKKFELVEALLGFVFSWWTFHHTAHDVHHDAAPLAQDLQLRIQRTRANFEETSKQTESLMNKMMEMRHVSADDEAEDGGVKAGYLFLMEKKAFGTTWTKQFARYERTQNLLALTPYNQINVKSSGPTENVSVCSARASSEAERRFCWEVTVREGGAGGAGGGAGDLGGGGPGGGEGPLTLQALGDRDRASWLRALTLRSLSHPPQNGTSYGAGGAALDAAGFEFVRALVRELEARGLDEQGLYRVGGVSSKVSRLLAAGASGALPSLSDSLLWDTRTLTSALKGFLRALPEPLTLHRNHSALLAAMQLETSSERVAAVRAVVQTLPAPNREMLQLVVTHLNNVVANSSRNLMSAANVSVCLGPSLMRAPRESVAAILELKFYNALVETLLLHTARIFRPDDDSSSPAPAANGSRTDINSCVSRSCGVPLARYSHHQQQLLQTFAAPPSGPAHPPAGPGHTPAHPAGPAPAARPPPPALLALRGVGRSSSSSAESVSSLSASPPPPPAPAGPAPAPGQAPPTPFYMHRHSPYRYNRVRTLYACLGESAGELSFEPNQIITNVTPSAEPGWLRGSLNGKVGLVPVNYVEPLP